MVSENLLIEKKFYETLLEGSEAGSPFETLGEAYLAEQRKETPELSDIRFAQGELYFHVKDYEAAIFKWENIHSDLAQWAKKNVADAYYELEMLPTAEDLYKGISTDSLVLRAEAALQLFSLYIEEKRFDLASRTIKEIVGFYPDYPNVAELARSFFEEQKDYQSAIELAASESFRTERIQWFDVLAGYVENGYTKALPPEYFEQLLDQLYTIDRKRFEQLVLSLWSVYREQDNYFDWLHTINAFLTRTEMNSHDSWNDLEIVYEQTFLRLINEGYYIEELDPIIPNLLTNWLKLADGAQSMVAAAAVISWNEIFPNSISPLVVSDAENKLAKARFEPNSYEASHTLFGEILKWSDQNDVNPGEKSKWIVHNLIESKMKNVLIAGAVGSNKASFVNSLVGSEVTVTDVPAYMLLRDANMAEIYEINHSTVVPVTDLNDIMPYSVTNSVYEVKFASEFLQKNDLVLIDTPELNSSMNPELEFIQLAKVSDGLLFVIDAEAPFTEKERSFLQNVKKQAPYLPIHFVINRIDKIHNEQEALRILDNTAVAIEQDFPESQLFAYSPSSDLDKQWSDTAYFIKQNFVNKTNKTDRLLIVIRQMLTNLLEKRAEVETSLIHSINWNEDILVKVNGAIHQLSDIEKEKIEKITTSYDVIKNEIKSDLQVTIPKILLESSEIVKEDSDFSRIHLALNKEMNERIQEYINRRALPKFYDALNNWIALSKREFNESQNYLNEMADGFNSLYGDDRIQLGCDFKVLDDWRRDADRITSGVHIEDVNILLRHTPSQLLFKGAGKVFDAIVQNKTAFYTRYKKFLETMDYDEVTETITKKFMSQFELFEKSLDRDIMMFFRIPKSELHTAVEQSQFEITENRKALDKMRERPEIYQDPITLFEIRLRQLEWIQRASK